MATAWLVSPVCCWGCSRRRERIQCRMPSSSSGQCSETQNVELHSVKLPCRLVCQKHLEVWGGGREAGGGKGEREREKDQWERREIGREEGGEERELGGGKEERWGSERRERGKWKQIVMPYVHQQEYITERVCNSHMVSTPVIWIGWHRQTAVNMLSCETQQ